MQKLEPKRKDRVLYLRERLNKIMDEDYMRSDLTEYGRMGALSRADRYAKTLAFITDWHYWCEK